MPTQGEVGIFMENSLKQRGYGLIHITMLTCKTSFF